MAILAPGRSSRRRARRLAMRRREPVEVVTRAGDPVYQACQIGDQLRAVIFEWSQGRGPLVRLCPRDTRGLPQV